MIGDREKQEVIERTQRWISCFVIGLNLCPFAGRVFQAGRIRYAVTDAEDEESLREDLTRELLFLGAPQASVETTLLIHPRVLSDFLSYNDFLEAGERLLRRLGLQSVIQIASFHPAYQFAGTEVEAVENYTNRSPYPMLHLLRQDSITAVAGNPDELAEIPRRNIETLRGLGLEKLKAMEDDR